VGGVTYPCEVPACLCEALGRLLEMIHRPAHNHIKHIHTIRARPPLQFPVDFMWLEAYLRSAWSCLADISTARDLGGRVLVALLNRLPPFLRSSFCRSRLGVAARISAMGGRGGGPLVEEVGGEGRRGRGGGGSGVSTVAAQMETHIRSHFQGPW
jgi:hypothetical protein